MTRGSSPFPPGERLGWTLLILGSVAAFFSYALWRLILAAMSAFCQGDHCGGYAAETLIELPTVLVLELLALVLVRSEELTRRRWGGRLLVGLLFFMLARSIWP